MSDLSGLKQLDPSVKRHNGGGSSFTLDEIGTTQATRLVVGGVEQVPNVDFTVSGATLSTTSATPSGTNNVVTFQYFKSGTVNTATAVSAGGVNNAAMADDAIGIAELSATGTASSSTFLRGDNAWAAPANPITLISDTDISDAATYNFTAFDSSKYDSYEWVFHNVVPATDAVWLYCRLSTDGGSSYDDGASDYAWNLHSASSSTYQNDQDTADAKISLGGDYNSGTVKVGSAADEGGVDGFVNMMFPNNASYQPKIGWMLHQQSNTANYMGAIHGGGVRLNAQDTDGIQFYFSSGNIESGTIKVYGRNVS